MILRLAAGQAARRIRNINCHNPQSCRRDTEWECCGHNFLLRGHKFEYHIIHSWSLSWGWSDYLLHRQSVEGDIYTARHTLQMSSVDWSQVKLSVKVKLWLAPTGSYLAACVGVTWQIDPILSWCFRPTCCQNAMVGLVALRRPQQSWAVFVRSESVQHRPGCSRE